MPCPKLIEQIQRPERLFPVEVWKAAYARASADVIPDGLQNGAAILLAGKTVVLKLVRDESNSAARHWGQRLQDLGDKARQVKNASIAETLDVGADGGIIYVATEYLDPAAGWKTLEDEAPKNTSLMVDQCVRIVWNVANGLVAMEKVGSVHGCITPTKVMVAPDPRDAEFFQVKLGHVGLGHLRVYEDYSAISLQLARYLAPELLDMDQSADIRSDIFSLGAVFFRILGGWPPVVGDTVNDVFEKKWKSKSPPEIRSMRPNIDKNESPALDEVLGKMLALDPKLRYQTARELVVALEKLAESFGIQLQPRTIQKIRVDEVWRDRDLVVAKRGANFPNRCVICNRDSGAARVRRTLHWHKKWLYSLAVFPGLLVYAIVAAIVEDSAAVEVGVCRSHRRGLSIAIALLCIMLVGAIASFVGAWYWQSIGLAGLGLGLIAAGAMIDFGFRTMLSARNIEYDLVWFSGAGRKYLDSLPEYDHRS